MRHFYAGSKNRLGQRRDSELLAENDGSQQLLVYFLFQKFFISDARQASCQNNVGNLWIVTHGYIESLSGKCTFFFFFYLQFFSFCCDNAVLMFWLYWGTRTSWFGLGKDHIFASCYSGNCPNILLKPYGSRLLIVLAKISSDVATASSFMLPIHAKMFVSNCTTVMPTYFCVLHVCMAVKQYNNKRPLLRVELVSRPPVLLRCLVPDQSPLSSCAVSVCLCAWPM